MFERIRRFVAKASALWPLIVGQLFGQQEVSPPVNAIDYLKYYRADPWIQSSVWVLASTAAKMPMRIVSPAGAYITDHKLLKVLARPNPGQTKFAFFMSTFMFLELVGNAYWEKVLSKLGTPLELYNARPDRMYILASGGRNEKIAGYEYRVPGEPEGERFDADEIVHIKYFDPADDWLGVGSIKPLDDTYVLDVHNRNWLTRFLRRFGTKDGYLGTDQQVGEQDSKRLGRRWSGRHTDEDKTPLLPKGLKYEETGDSPMDNKGVFDVDKMTQMRKLAVVGVPPVKVGLLEYAKYRSYDQQSRAFVQDTVSSKLEILADAINTQLLPDYPTLEGHRFEFDTSKAIFTDVLSYWTGVVGLFDRNGLTVNELIELTGMGVQFEGGEKRWSDIRREILKESTRSPADRSGAGAFEA